MALPPGPRSALLHGARFVRDPVGLLTGLQERYGDAFSVPFPIWGRLVYFAHPDAIKQIFTGDPSVFHSGEAIEPVLSPVVGQSSVFVLDEEDHLRERRLLLPPFHGERVQGYAGTFAELAEREVERWPVGEPFKLRERMQSLTLEAILRTVFGVRDPERIARFQERVPRMARTSILVVMLPVTRRGKGRLTPWGRFLRARESLYELVYEEIDRAQADPAIEERDDVLALMLQARREDGTGMTREQLRDELMTVVAAGHETTATGLSWLFERVLRHPSVEERLRAEIASGGDEYLDATVRETLRVRPVVMDVVRRLTRDTEIGAFTLPAGSHVIPAIALVQLREDVYPGPLAFRPERWLGEAPPTTYTWIPFGGGVRRCIGAAFAQLEMKVMARTILERVRLTAPDPRDEAQRAEHVTVVPSRGGQVMVQERLDSAPSVTSSRPAVTAA
jgi:cytochrome P450